MTASEDQAQAVVLNRFIVQCRRISAFGRKLFVEIVRQRF